MPVFRFDQQSRTVRFEGIGRTFQDRQFVPFDVDLHKPNVAQMEAVKGSHPHNFIYRLSRQPVFRLNRRTTQAKTAALPGNTQVGRKTVIGKCTPVYRCINRLGS